MLSVFHLHPLDVWARKKAPAGNTSLASLRLQWLSHWGTQWHVHPPEGHVTIMWCKPKCARLTSATIVLCWSSWLSINSARKNSPREIYHVSICSDNIHVATDHIPYSFQRNTVRILAWDHQHPPLLLGGCATWRNAHTSQPHRGPQKDHHYC